MMPGMSGFDVCEAVRADEQVRDTRILMLTAKGRDTDVARGVGVGADAYVTKPFSTRELMAEGPGNAGMKLDRRLVLAMLAPGAALAVWLALGGVLLRATLDPAQRAAVDAALGPLVATHGMLPVLWWLVAAALAAWAARRLYEAHVAAPARLADATRVLIGDAGGARSRPAGRRGDARPDRGDQRACRPAPGAAGGHGAAGGRGEPRRGAAARPARRADGRAEPERGGLQPRRADPALQRARAPAVPPALARAAGGRGRRADRARAVRSTASSTAP